jgi:hypothetical protein
MLSFRYFAAGLIMAVTYVGGAAAQEPSRSPGPKAPPSASSIDKPKLEGINCTYGIACPIISIPVPDVPLETIKPCPPRP